MMMNVTCNLPINTSLSETEDTSLCHELEAESFDSTWETESLQRISTPILALNDQCLPVFEQEPEVINQEIGVHVFPTQLEINNVPDDCLLCIYSYLDQATLLQCPRVCGRWNALFKCYKIINNIDAASRKLSPAALERLPKTYYPPGIIRIRLREIDQSSFLSVRKLLEETQELQSLAFWSSTFISRTGNQHKNKMFNVSFFPKSLVHLSLRGSTFNHHDFFLRNPGEYLPNLRCLDVGRTKSLGVDCLHTYFKITSLRSLYLEDCFESHDDYTDIPLEFGWQSIRNLVHLQVLDLEGSRLSSDAVPLIIDNCPNLNELFLCFTNVTDQCLLNVRRKETALSKLCLIGTSISAGVIVNFLSHSCSQNEITVWCTIFKSEQGVFKNVSPNCNVIAYYAPHCVRCWHILSHVCI